MKRWNDITTMKTVTLQFYYVNLIRKCIHVVSKNRFQMFLLTTSHFKQRLHMAEQRLGQNVSDQSTSTANHCQLKLPSKSLKRYASSPTKRADKYEHRKARWNRHQEENPESEELFARIEHWSNICNSQLLFIVWCSNKDPIPHLKHVSTELKTHNLVPSIDPFILTYIIHSSICMYASTYGWMEGWINR